MPGLRSTAIDILKKHPALRLQVRKGLEHYHRFNYKRTTGKLPLDEKKVLFETLGFEDSKRALVHYPKEAYGRELADNTHFNPYGAYEVAKCVVMGMKQLNLPLVQYLRPEWKDYNPAQPDDWRPFQWAPSPMTEATKPDGN